MIEVKRVKVLSAKVIAAFGEQARKEWNECRGYRSLFYITTDKIWTLYIGGQPMCVLGFKRTSLIGSGGEVLFMLCKGFSKHGKTVLAFIKRAIQKVMKFYRTLMVRVEEGYWIGEKFVRFFGFRPTEMVTEIDKRNYKLYELR